MELSPELYWLMLALILLGIEIATGTFVVLFFSVAAFLIAATSWLGVLKTLDMQLVVFGLLGVSGLLLFKNKVRSATKSQPDSKVTIDQGETITLEHDLNAGRVCEVTYQGTKWTAVNQSDKNFLAGDRVTIAKVEGVKLIIR